MWLGYRYNCNKQNIFCPNALFFVGSCYQDQLATPLPSENQGNCYIFRVGPQFMDTNGTVLCFSELSTEVFWMQRLNPRGYVCVCVCVYVCARRSFHKGNIFCNLFSSKDPCQFCVLLNNAFVPTLILKLHFKCQACFVDLNALAPRHIPWLHPSRSPGIEPCGVCSGPCSAAG